MVNQHEPILIKVGKFKKTGLYVAYSDQDRGLNAVGDSLEELMHNTVEAVNALAEARAEKAARP